MEIRTEYKSFNIRFIKGLVVLILFSIAIFIMCSLTTKLTWIPLILVIPGLLILIPINYLQEKYFVTVLICNKDNVYIEYYKINTLIKDTMNFKEFDLLYGGIDLSRASSRLGLVFRKNKKRFLTQYVGGYWTKDKIMELYEYVKKERLNRFA